MEARLSRRLIVFLDLAYKSVKARYQADVAHQDFALFVQQDGKRNTLHIQLFLDLFLGICKQWKFYVEGLFISRQVIRLGSNSYADDFNIFTHVFVIFE